eukprot:CAMPEP_0197575106 /NCGR_PEP_ID=MMETSP1326-20131121/619_1 /TAXON_ID=1155430 /ORGANISM="Genus nov. species nov., Strain RCC2288" /LENGTH=148 /DNA_ID=CAMNT_0043137813 /DNA_START=35 /DNA_END=481 /DNA_ORIENTATION=-
MGITEWASWLLTTSRCEEAQPVEAEPVEAEPVKAEPVEAEPVEAEPVEAEPVAAEEEAVEEEVEPEEEAEPARVIKLETTPFDPRFPQQNQAKHCYTRYNEFHKCQSQKGEGAEECEKYARWYRSICPTDWTNKWNEERENGTWPGRY